MESIEELLKVMLQMVLLPGWSSRQRSREMTLEQVHCGTPDLCRWLFACEPIIT